MNPATCPREDELLDALAAGFIGAELSSHVTQCAACGDLHAVAGALLDDRKHAVAEAPLPSSGTMLWRMKMRHSQDAQSAARRTLLIGQAVTLVVAIALTFTFFGSAVAVEVKEVFSVLRVSTPMLIALASWVLLAPIGGYLAIRQK
ncbi:MAG TPA: hypothetical protein VEU30_01365 [Thermoanaerobaculia bacterium]|nr:hypothetical protein [Thermoanaerobaculia bacterium]